MQPTEMNDLLPPDDPDFALLQAYVDELHGGGAPAKDALIARRPDLAGLIECLDGLNRLAAPFTDDFGTVTIAVRPMTPPRPDPEATVYEPRPHGRFGKYLLEEELGRGGMGVVYKARQTDLGRAVALKMILSNHLAAPDAIGRFQEEARAAAGLTHPNIVAVYEAGQLDGQPYFAMQYVAGCSLSQRIRSGPVPHDEAAQLVHIVAGAVQHLHDHGIVHRDLKPSNILLDETGNPFVTDFGLVKVLEGDSHRTVSGAIIGTPSYMSPEQASGRRDLGPASDVYSLGAILYELLTGRAPFHEESPLDTLVQVLESEPTPPRRLSPQVPAELELICLRCLEKTPAERFASAHEVAHTLGAFLKGEDVGVSLPGLRYRLRRWARREPALACRLVLLLVCMLISLANYALGLGVGLGLHLKVVVILTIWGAASFACQWLMNQKPLAEATRFLWAGADIVLFSLIMLVADDITTPVVIGYPLMVAAAGLWFRVPLVWFTAAGCVISYIVLLDEAAQRLGTLEGLHKHVIFMAGLAVLAYMTSYQVQRVRALSRYYEHRKLP
jgi:tRNA A-37 threonylcarbamoyl transferase component Bud32